MLRDLQKKVTNEGREHEKRHKKFVCYCESNSKYIKKSIAAAESKIPSLTADVEGAQRMQSDTDSDLGYAQVEVNQITGEIQDLLKDREQSAAQFAKCEKDLKETIVLLEQAIKALEKGLGLDFLQTDSAAALCKLLSSKASALEVDTSGLLAFMSGSPDPGYIGVTGTQEVLGTLRQLKDEFERDLKDFRDKETAAIAYSKELIAAKKVETTISTKRLTMKQPLSAELGISIADMKHDLDDTTAALAEDRKYLKELEKNCATKASGWEAGSKARGEELAAIAEVIQLLEEAPGDCFGAVNEWGDPGTESNSWVSREDSKTTYDEDSRYTTYPSAPHEDEYTGIRIPSVFSAAAASFIQVSRCHDAKAQARKIIRKASKQDSRLNFIAFALQGKRKGFQSVIKHIDSMIKLLQEEQAGDDEKKEYCVKEFSYEEHKVKDWNRLFSESKVKVSRFQASLTAVNAEIEALRESIQETDKSVKEATEQRKAEADAYAEMMKVFQTAQALLGSAIKRLNKVYTAQLQEAEESAVPEDEEVVVSFADDLGFVQTSMVTKRRRHRHHHSHDADSGDPPGDPQPPPPAPEYKRCQGGFEAVKLIQVLIKDLEKYMDVAQTNEKVAQRDYETLMDDAAEKRKADVAQLTQKNVEKASLSLELTNTKEEGFSLSWKLRDTQEAVTNMKEYCDFILQNYDQRRQARIAELNELGYVKEVLSGATFGGRRGTGGWAGSGSGSGGLQPRDCE